MAAGKYNFTIEQGSTFDLTIRYKDASGSYIDLTGYGATMQLRPDVADNTTNIYLTLSSSLQPDGTGLNMTDAASGSIGIYISAITSSMLDFGESLYDLEISSGSFVSRILSGKVKNSKEVTRI